MSPHDALQASSAPQSNTSLEAGAASKDSLSSSSIHDIVESVRQKIAPVWPLRDYVAVNPYIGFAEHEFLTVRNYLRTLSDLELFMPVDYYRQQYAQGKLQRCHVDTAVDELVYDGVAGAECIDVNQVIFLLNQGSGPTPTADAEFTTPENANRTLYSVSELMDAESGSNWCRLINEEISKQCSTHYDQGQAAWASSSRERSLYAAWHSEKQIDRTLEIQGVAGFRSFVAQLPEQPDIATHHLLNQLGVPQALREDYLLCLALTVPGWSAWTQYQQRTAEQQAFEGNDFAGLLAMRLAYEVALCQHTSYSIDWTTIVEAHVGPGGQAKLASQDDLLRYALLKANEVAYRTQLLNNFRHQRPSAPAAAQGPKHSSESPSTQRKLAKLVFCIDVRSERIRRHLEASSTEIETFGFAGFFGLPMEFVELGSDSGQANVPVLISPQFKVHEGIDSPHSSCCHNAIKQRSFTRFLRHAWKTFQSSAVSMFAFVETTGLLYAWQLLGRSLGWTKTSAVRFDGVAKSDRARLGPSLDGLKAQGVGISEQADWAESALRGIGISSSFPRLVVFCGHGSAVENNPLKAGLDCGACGGHSGEPNARLAAKILNQSEVRIALAERGIEIPDETHFLAAVHNTTTDELEFFDQHAVPQTHVGDLQELVSTADLASEQTRLERLPSLPGTDTNELHRRSRDWSEVRPEWGLAGNATFIAAPRELTRTFSLDGRSFLHSYDFRNDPEFGVLEQIMTAPLVVANWINMQYYASTVDPVHFGSGNKTVHNVVGHFGVLSGNSGDLMTGLPWQSVHDGQQYQHHPLRLLAVLAAPREAIDSILARHKLVADLCTRGWLQLVALDGDQCYRHTERGQWEEIAGPASAFSYCAN